MVHKVLEIGRIRNDDENRYVSGRKWKIGRTEVKIGRSAKKWVDMTTLS